VSVDGSILAACLSDSTGIVLQCVAVCCSVLQCVAVCCIILAACLSDSTGIVLQCVAVCCSVLYYLSCVSL